MTQLNGQDRNRLQDRRCAFCAAPLIEGPTGGRSQNFYCSDRANCLQGFNLTFWKGALIFQQHIGTISDGQFRRWDKDRKWQR